MGFAGATARQSDPFSREFTDNGDVIICKGRRLLP
jgi:hypothetical protein